MLIKIRNAEMGDSDSFVKIYIKAYRGIEYYAYSSKRDIKNYFNWLMRRDKSGVFVAEVGFTKGISAIAGFLACDSNWYSKYENEIVGEIHEIFVKPEFRGKGVGTALVNKAIEYAKIKNRKTIELWVGDRNEKAISFYLNLGFKNLGKSGCWIRMVKRF